MEKPVSGVRIFLAVLAGWNYVAGIVRRGLPRSRAAGNTVRLLVEDVAEGIRVLQTRDGIQLSNDQIVERARNIVAGLIGNYNIQSLDAREPGPSAPTATKRAARTVDQLDLLDQVEKRAERQNGGRPARA
jgi:hypothetical protein